MHPRPLEVEPAPPVGGTVSCFRGLQMSDESRGSIEPGYRDGYFLVTDGLRLHYRDYPGAADRPPILCLPGLTRNCRDFDAFARTLSPRHRVLVSDFRGRGQSAYDREPARYIPVTYANAVIVLLN